MNKNLIFIFLLFFFRFYCLFPENLEINVGADQHEKMNLLIGKIDDRDKFLVKIAQILKINFEFGEQFNVDIRDFENLKTKKELLEFSNQGFPLIIFLNKDKKTNGIEWRLYDTINANMIAGKKVFQIGDNNFSLAHLLSDQIWQSLIGEKSSFSSAIVACKKIKKFSHLYILHPIEFLNKISIAKPLITDSKICISPRWNPTKPIVYYSTHTPYNIRLMSIDLNKKKRIISNFDGLNMTPSFSNDGKTIVVLTKNGKSGLFKYDFDEIKKTGKFIPISDEQIQAVSPSFIDDNKIVFCAIDNSNIPRIAILHINENIIEYISENNSVSPSYNSNNNKIAYCKKIDQFFQIFCYDLNSKNHQQYTFDEGDKDSCSWSECGNYLAFSIENNNKSKIGILNLLTEKYKFITPENEHWTNPAWSPVYEEVPFM